MLSFKQWLMESKEDRQMAFRGKHPHDYNHGKSGYVTGNPRYAGKSGHFKPGGMSGTRIADKQDLKRELEDEV